MIPEPYIDPYKPSGLPNQIFRWSISKGGGKIPIFMGWQFQYWHIPQRFRAIRIGIKQQVRQYFAGFCPMCRGMHWDRRSRYGEK